MIKIKQGQTRYKVVIYEPGKVQGYDDEYVAMIYSCFVTKVNDGTVFYRTENGSYICRDSWFIKNTKSSKKKAITLSKTKLGLITGNFL